MSCPFEFLGLIILFSAISIVTAEIIVRILFISKGDL